MAMRLFLSSFLTILLTVTFSGCSTMQLIAKAKREDEITLAVWTQARTDLHQLCLQNYDNCRPRWIIKIPKQGHISFADWDYEILPSYKTVIDTHERLFRQAKEKGWRGGDFEGLWVNEEILFGIARALAERSDNGEITPDEMKAAFTAAWNKNYDETVRQIGILVQNAKTADDNTIRVASAVVTVVAAAATGALIAATAARPAYTYYSPRPLYCTATRSFNTIYVSCV